MKVLAIAALLFLAAVQLSPNYVTTSASPQTFRHIYVDPAHMSTTHISGFSDAHSAKLEPGSDAFLEGLDFDEKSDKPCFIRAHWWRFTETSLEQHFTNTFDICKGDANGDKSLVFTSTPALRQAVDGIKVCSNNDKDHRMKGVELSTAFIDRGGTGKTEAAGLDLRFERTNCASWKAFQNCPAGMAAIGLNIEHSGEEITGLGLHCTQPLIRPLNVSVGSGDSDDEQYSKMEHDIRVQVSKSGSQTMSIKEAVALHEVNAATVVVMSRGKIAEVHHYGVRSRKSNLPVNNDTIYPTASLSKIVSSVGMLIAADMDHGPKLLRSVQASANEFPNSLIARWVDKEFKGKEKDYPPNITISRLLSHTAGLNTHSIGTARHDSKTDMENILLGSGANPGVKPNNPPGVVNEYSGGGYVAAESMLELHSGRTATEFLNTEVLKRFHLNKSTFKNANDDMVNLARGCSRGVCSDTPEYTSVKFAGGLLANPEEYAKLLLIIVNDGKDENGKLVLPLDRVHELITPASLITSSRRPCKTDLTCGIEKCYNEVCIFPIPGSRYGLGVGFGTSDYAGYPRTLNHSGGQDNVATYFSADRLDGSGVVIMITGETKWNKNGADFGADALLEDIKDAYNRNY